MVTECTHLRSVIDFNFNFIKIRQKKKLLVEKENESKKEVVEATSVAEDLLTFTFFFCLKYLMISSRHDHGVLCCPRLDTGYFRAPNSFYPDGPFDHDDMLVVHRHLMNPEWRESKKKIGRIMGAHV